MYQLPVFSAINPYSKLCNPLVGQIYYNQRISEGLD